MKLYIFRSNEAVVNSSVGLPGTMPEDYQVNSFFKIVQILSVELDLGGNAGHHILALDLRFVAFLRVGCSLCSELLFKRVQILSMDLDLGGKAGYHILALEICGFSQGQLLTLL